MKLHLPKLLLTAVLTVVMAMPALAFTVTNNTDGTTTITSGEWSQNYNTNSLYTNGVGGRWQINGGSSTANDATPSTSVDGTKTIVVGNDNGQLFLQLWGTGAAELNNAMILGGGGQEGYGTIRFGNDGAAANTATLNGAITLIEDATFSTHNSSVAINIKGAITSVNNSTLTVQGKGYVFSGAINVGGLTLKEGWKDSYFASEIVFNDKSSVTAGNLTVGSNTTASFAGSLTIGGTIKNSGSLSIAKTINVENWENFDYTFTGGEDATDNGLVGITKTYQILSGNALATGSTTEFTYGDYNGNIADGYTVQEGSAYVIAKDSVTVDLTDAGSDAAKADRLVLKGGTLNLAAGSLSTTLVRYTDGSVILAEGTSYTGLDSVADAELIGSIGGEGTIEVTGKSDYSATFNPSSDFTGTVYVKSGNFTYDGSSFGKTLKLAQGVNFQVNAASTLAADETLTLESGTHEVHVNDREDNKFTILGTVNGDGTLKHRGTKKAVCIEGNAVVNKFDNNEGGLYVQGAATVNYLTASGGTTNVSGGSVTTLSTTGGTTNVSGGSVSNMMSTGGTTNITGTVSIGGGANFASTHVSGIYLKENGTVNIGDGTSTNTVTVTRVEMGDNQSANGGVLNVKSNATLVVTDGDVTTGQNAYHKTGLLLGEWESASTVNVAGKLLAENATLFVGDKTANVVIDNGGILAVKGIGLPKVANDKTQAINLTLNDGGKVVLGEAGINTSKPFSGVLGAGTIGISADAAINTALALKSSTGTTFDTQKYVWGEGGASIAQGTDGGTLSISGVISDHSVTTTEGEGDSATSTTTNYPGKLVKTGAGTLELSGANTYSGGTDINAGTVKTGNATALGTGAVSVAEGASLELGASLEVSDLTIAEGGSLIFGNGTTLTVTGTLTLTSANDIKLAEGVQFTSAAAQQLINKTGGLTAEDVASWTGGTHTIGGKEYTAGLSTADNVLSLTFTELLPPSTDPITTTVKDYDFLDTENPTALTLYVEEAVLSEGMVVNVHLLDDTLMKDILAKLDEVNYTDGKPMVTITLAGSESGTITADKLNEVVFVKGETGQNYWGEMVGGQLMYNVERIPEPTTATLSLLALMGLAARRRRQK